MGIDNLRAFIFSEHSRNKIDDDTVKEIIKILDEPNQESNRLDAEVKADNGGQDDNYCQCSDDEFIDCVRCCGNCWKRIKFD